MPYIDIILFACVALFIFVRLRNVLGRRTGHERRRDVPPPSPSTSNDNVVSLPSRGSSSGREGDPFRDIGDQTLKEGLQAIHAKDRSFDLEQFVEGAKLAFEVIVESFAKGDKSTLEPLLAEDVYGGFASAIDSRDAAGETLDTELVAIRKADPVAAELAGSEARVTVRFETEQIKVTRNAEGETIDGDPERITDVVDVWTFARDTRSGDPNWVLVRTEVAD
ncbi:MAG: Tim44/TimA family putative adaptor protein [Geminicoccaceae bacterium]